MPKEIERSLLAAEQTLNDWQTRYPPIVKAAAETRLVYDLAYADALVEIDHRVLAEGEKKPTVAIIEAMATQMVEKQMSAARVAEAEQNAAKEVIKINLAILSSFQTRAKMEMSEMSLV
jgi:hypothetical protein